MNEPGERSRDNLAEVFGEALFDVLRLMGLLLASGPAAAAGDIERLTQHSMAIARTRLLTVEETQAALRRFLLDPHEATFILTQMGFSDRAQEVIRGLVYQVLDIGSLVESRKRGDIDATAYLDGARQLGYTDADAETLARLAEYVPTAPDVVAFAVREVYNPEIAQKYGQYQEFPEDAMPDFTRAGLPRAQAEKYWAAHWQLVSIEQAIAMYHRRAETGFTLDDVMQLLRAQDVMPYYREKLLAIASAPYTRVDVRRMHKLGILDLDDVAEAYQALGYSDERARNLALFTERLNAQEDNDAIEPFRSGLRSRMVTMYQNGTLPRADLSEGLGNLGYTPEQIAAFVAEADFIRTANLFDDWRASVAKLYVGGHWSREMAIGKLIDLGFAESELPELFALWDVQRELRDVTAEERAQKDLTKTEIVAAYRESILSDLEASESLRALGYDDAEVESIIRLADAAMLRAARADAESTAHTLYVGGKEGESAARTRLAAAGLGADRVEALMVKWAGEIDAKIPDLTIAQLQAAMKKNLLTPTEVNSRLTLMGYSEADRRIIIELA